MPTSLFHIDFGNQCWVDGRSGTEIGGTSSDTLEFVLDERSQMLDSGATDAFRHSPMRCKMSLLQRGDAEDISMCHVKVVVEGAHRYASVAQITDMDWGIRVGIGRPDMRSSALP